MTLDELHSALVDMGFNLSRSATYLRLVPRRSTSSEGKLHVNTVPVKLCRAQADHHREHADQYFCRATIHALEEIASVLGPKQVCVLSQDDKAKVPIGLTAAKCQTPLLIHLEYKLRLADHDFAIGTRHKLTPSVYALFKIRENCMGRREAVTFSGPTYIAIRSAKHSSSSAATHAKDFETMIDVPQFQPFIKNDEGKVKPVLLVSCDGGPDENPRYKKVIGHAIDIFKRHDLDAIFVFTNAPGRSAFNRVERCMAPLSRALSGVILPYDHYGSHLDSSGRTVDLELEIQNFQHAGESLAEIWSNLMIDGHEVVASYVPPTETLPESSPEVTPSWYAEHIRESQYLLQIVKCDNLSCCQARRSDLRKILYQRFLPAPFPLSQEPMEIPSDPDSSVKFPTFLLRQATTIRSDYPQSKEVPYDLFCPTVKDEIQGRTCTSCGLYFNSKASLQNHKKGFHGTDTQCSRVKPLRVLCRRPGELMCILSSDEPEWVDVESVDEGFSAVLEEDGDSGAAPIISSVAEWIDEGTPFLEDHSSKTDF